MDGGYFFDLTPSKISETGGGIGWVPIILSAASIPAFIFGIINEYFALVRFSRPAILLLGLVDLGLFVITMVLGVLGSVQTKEIDCGWMNLDRTVGGVAEVVLFDGSERLRCEAWRGINGVTVSLS